MSIISSFASILNLALIYDMQVWSGFTALITIMSISQLLYDLSFYPNNSPLVDTNAAIFIASSIIHCFGGVTQAITSNIISLVVLFTVKYQRTFDIFKNFNILLFTMTFPAFILLLFYFISLGVSNNTELATVLRQTAIYGYFTIRLASIVGVALTHAYTSYLVYRMTRNVKKTAKDLAIQTLMKRLQWYPIVQALSRSVYCFYELRYAFTFNPFAVVSLSSVEFSNLTQFAILVTTELLTPITAVCSNTLSSHR